MDHSNATKRLLILWLQAFFVIIFILARMTDQGIAKVKNDKNAKTDSKKLTGNYLLLLPGFYYTTYEGEFLSSRKNMAWGGAIEHLIRINASHELVVGGMYQQNQPSSGSGLTSINGYFLRWRYHIPSFNIGTIYSLFFDFSGGIYEFNGGDLTNRLRSRGFEIGLGNRFSFQNNLILQLGVRLRNLKFNILGRAAGNNEIQGSGTEILNTVSIQLGLGYRYFSW